jgi:hypothetical protein
MNSTKKLGIGIMAFGVVLFLVSSTTALSGTSGACAPNTAGLCITGDTPNPSTVGQAVAFTGTAPAPPTGSVWTLYCDFIGTGYVNAWQICGATSSTGAWTTSLTFNVVGSVVVEVALNNAGLAGGWAQVTQTVNSNGVATTTTTVTSTSTSTLPVTTTITTTVSGTATTVTTTITSFSTIPYTSVTTTTYVTSYTTTVSGTVSTVVSTVTTTTSTGGSFALGVISYLSFLVILVGAVIYWQGGRHR